MKNVKETQFGFKWGDMEVIRSSEDFECLLVLKIKRSDRVHEITITKDGEVSIQKLK